MAAQRRSSKQRRRGSGAATATAPEAAAIAAQPGADVQPAKQPGASSKSTSPKSSTDKTASSKQSSATAAKPSKFRTTWDNLNRMLQNTISEIKKISWPDAETTRNLTGLVIAMSTVLGLLLGGIDFLLLRLFETF